MRADDEDLVLLAAYCDGEMSPGEALAMERRLSADPDLRALAEQFGTLSRAVKAAVAAPPVPTTLRDRVLRRLGTADAAARRPLRVPRQAVAAALLLGLVGGGVLGGGATYIGLASRPDPTLDAVLAGHLRGLIAPQPFDIASSDRHVVKPWFNGRTTIAPEAPDLAGKGFPLAGGRIDIVDGRPVPTLVYRSDQHVISVTILPATTKAAQREVRHDGSTIEIWNAGDLTYWAVSDLNVKDLRGFVELFRAVISPSAS